MDKKTHKKIESLLTSPIENNQELGALLGKMHGWTKEKIESFILSPWEINFKSIRESLENYSGSDLSLLEIKEENELIKQRIIRECLTN